MPPSVTYHVVVPFDRNEDGELRPGEAAELPSAESARRRTQALSLKHIGAVAFSRTGDPATGEFGDAEVIAQIGEVDLDALSA